MGIASWGENKIRVRAICNGEISEDARKVLDGWGTEYVKPDFGWVLHDKASRYSEGGEGQEAFILNLKFKSTDVAKTQEGLRILGKDVHANSPGTVTYAGVQNGNEFELFEVYATSDAFLNHLATEDAKKGIDLLVAGEMEDARVEAY